MRIIHKQIHQYLYHLDDIYNHRRKQLSGSRLLLVYQVAQDYVRYWRQLDDRGFYGMPPDACDELYYQFNKKLEEICALHLDIYWLTWDLDSQPLYKDGREPDPFWRFPFVDSSKRRWIR